jgi:hypothetical protein
MYMMAVRESSLPEDVRRDHRTVPEDLRKFKEAEDRGDLRTGVDAASHLRRIHAFFKLFSRGKLFGGNRHWD